MLTDEQRIEIQREVGSQILELLSSDWLTKGAQETIPNALLVQIACRRWLARGSTTERLLTLGRDIGKTPRGADTVDLAAELPSPQTQALEPLVRIIARAVEVLGTSEKALRWLNTPIRSLGDQTPVSLLGTPEGISRVEDALGRIEHGVW